jgi:transcriptional regulator GlxA family with amidase domain
MKSIGTEVPTMAYKRPDVRILSTVHAFWDQRISTQSDEATEMDWRARKIKEFVDSHPGKVGWNLDDLCKRLGLPVSGRQARRVFRSAIRIGFKEYLKKSRLAFAAEQLKATTTEPIKAIAADAGYERAAEFGRSFKSLFLLSPTEFRTVWHQNKRAA